MFFYNRFKFYMNSMSKQSLDCSDISIYTALDCMCVVRHKSTHLHTKTSGLLIR